MINVEVNFHIINIHRAF